MKLFNDDGDAQKKNRSGLAAGFFTLHIRIQNFKEHIDLK